MSTSTCPTAPPYPPTTQGGLGEFLDKAGIQACKKDTETSERHMRADASIKACGIGLFCPSANMSASFDEGSAKTHVEGCESVIAKANEYSSTVNSVKCLLTNMNSSTNISTTTIQSVNVSKLKCSGNLDLSQLANINVKVASNITDQVKKDIKDVIKQGLKKQNDMLQKSETGFASTEAGQKLLEQNKTTLNQSETDTNITNKINQIYVSMFSRQELILNDVDVLGNCNISQNIAIDIAAANMVGQSYDLIFASYKSAEAEYNDKIKQDSIAKGQPTLKVADNKKNDDDDNNTIQLVILACLVFAVLYYIVPMIL
jgi:hypothetical protein